MARIFRDFFERYKHGGAVTVAADSDYTIPNGNDSVFLLTKTSAADNTVTLPNVAESAGRVIEIEIESYSGVNKYTIADAGDDKYFTNIDLSAAGASALLVCTGRRWYQIN